MSYTSELKQEICQDIPNKREAYYIIAGMVVSSARFKFDGNQVEFSMRTGNPVLARYIYRTIYKRFHVRGEITASEETRFKKHKIINIAYPDSYSLLEELGCLSKRNGLYYSPVLNNILDEDNKEKRLFLKGIFLSCGSILNPKQNYHLEIDAPNEAVTEVCAEILESLGITCSLNYEYKKGVIYIKESQSIADFLGLIGATKKYFELEDLLILKQLRGNANRRVNFETANLNKTAETNLKQIRAIEKLKETGHFKQLAPELKEAAKFRLKYPDSSLSQLAKKSSISRSTLHRRLNKLIDLSEDIPSDSN